VGGTFGTPAALQIRCTSPTARPCWSPPATGWSCATTSTRGPA